MKITSCFKYVSFVVCLVGLTPAFGVKARKSVKNSENKAIGNNATPNLGVVFSDAQKYIGIEQGALKEPKRLLNDSEVADEVGRCSQRNSHGFLLAAVVNAVSFGISSYVFKGVSFGWRGEQELTKSLLSCGVLAVTGILYASWYKSNQQCAQAAYDRSFRETFKTIFEKYVPTINKLKSDKVFNGEVKNDLENFLAIKWGLNPVPGHPFNKAFDHYFQCLQALSKDVLPLIDGKMLLCNDPVLNKRMSNLTDSVKQTEKCLYTILRDINILINNDKQEQARAAKDQAVLDRITEGAALSLNVSK